jgi:hypothetical protein
LPQRRVPPSWQGVVPPRVRDAVDDEPEGDIERQLRNLAERYRGAYDAWVECVADLGDEIGLDPSER